MTPHRLDNGYLLAAQKLCSGLPVILLVLFSLSGCNENGDTPEKAEAAVQVPDKLEQPTSILNFDVSIETTDKFGQPSLVFAQGDPINIILSIKNTSATTQVLDFNSGQQCDFSIKDRNGAEVWRWSDGKFFTLSFTSYAIAPGATHTIQITWNQLITDTGPVIPVGNYTIEADRIGVDAIPKQNLGII